MLNFGTDEVIEDVSEGLQDVGVELRNADVLCLFDSADHAQRALDTFSRSVTPFGMCLAPSKCQT